MYLIKVDRKNKKQDVSHTAILLRESYREGSKVKTRVIANLTNAPKNDIAAIEWALQNKDNLDAIKSRVVKSVIGKRFGSVYLVNMILKKLGISKNFGNDLNGKLAIMQIISRLINQGSRLSTIRNASHQALCEVLQIEDKICEDDLYKNLTWISKNQRKIETKIFKTRYKNEKPSIYLYDVTSSYFEGNYNELANFGYNRDKKNGKKQVVAGLLCDSEGLPISIELFEGNTLDFNTLANQIRKVANDFSCKNVTFVGDRGMIKSKQIESLKASDFFYITALTKPQMEKMLSDKVFEMSFFDIDLKEVEHDSVRYVLRRNPVRAAEISRTRDEKYFRIAKLCNIKNDYLANHPRAKVATAINVLNAKIKTLKLDSYLTVSESKDKKRELEIHTDQDKLNEISRLDGCYVIKSNLSKEVDKEEIHSRYKDLSLVENNFKYMKTEALELRPWFVLKAENTRAHAFVAMLAHLVFKELQKCWKDIDITVQEGLTALDSICMIHQTLESEETFVLIPEPNERLKILLDAVDVKLPRFFPNVNVNVGTRKKLKR